jgi:hypothetical protein
MSYNDPGRFEPPNLEDLERIIVMLLQGISAALIIGITIEFFMRAGLMQ